MTVAAVAALSGCLPSSFSPGASTPAPATDAPDTVTPSATSLAYVRYYADVEQRLLSQGLLRVDGGGPDTPVTARNLVSNFERIALYDEYTLRDGHFVAQQTPSMLRRWERPVRIQPHFGASVPEAVADADREFLRSYAQRLAQVTGHSIRAVGSGGNYHVLYLNRDEQLAAGPLLRELVPGIDDATVREITTLPRYTFCSVYSFSEAGGRPVYVASIALIRAEHPDLLRQSCVHEEIAQGLGLPNDSPVARPSIFNDDEEFALLTTHDEMLLRMLYNDNLTPGMTPSIARPILQEIAEGLVGGPS